MKEVKAYIQPFMLQKMTDALHAIHVRGMSISELKGCGREKDESYPHHACETVVEFTPKVKIEIVCPNGEWERIVKAIQHCRVDKHTLVGYIGNKVCQTMITRRRGKRQQRIGIWFAILCSVAFIGAVNYCNLEAFAAHPTQSHDTHQSASTEHHEEDSSAPAHHHDEDSVSCCAAMQALATSKSDLNLASCPAWQPHPFSLQSSWLASFLEPSRTASGLSPPTREPPPARPFYRTAYANHAPPVRLA